MSPNRCLLKPFMLPVSAVHIYMPLMEAYYKYKAYKHVQMFFVFLSECLEFYYTHMLLSGAHNRMDRYISLNFKVKIC